MIKQPFSLLMPADLLAEFKEFCNTNGFSYSGLVSVLIRDRLRSHVGLTQGASLVAVKDTDNLSSPEQACKLNQPTK